MTDIGKVISLGRAAFVLTKGAEKSMASASQEFGVAGEGSAE